MLILVSNDDGFDAPGILQLIELIGGQADVYMAAPDRERSASGHGITVSRPLRARTVSNYQGLVKGWAIDGTPADTVKLAVDSLLPRTPDLVVSGINRGANLGNDVIYSGTVSAAVEAVMLGVPAIAVSNVDYEVTDYYPAAKIVEKLVKLVSRNSLPVDTLLNVNVPNLPLAEIKGFRICHLGKRQYSNAIHPRKDPRGVPYFWLGGDVVNLYYEEGTDIHAVNNGFVSVTPIHFDLTNYKVIDQIKSWDFSEISD